MMKFTKKKNKINKILLKEHNFVKENKFFWGIFRIFFKNEISK